MATDGSGLRVDIGVLEAAASSIRETMEDQHSGELRDACGPASEYGHAGLHGAFAEFAVRWSDAIDGLIVEGGEIADALSDSAATYREADAAGIEALGFDPAWDVADG